MMTKGIWHPYTQYSEPLDIINIKKAKGSLVWDEKGKAYIDAISTWWTSSHGHLNSYICDKLKKQLDLLDHFMFAGFSHDTAIELTDRLLRILPSNQNKLFFSDNGSTSIELAIKIALLYFDIQGKKNNKVIAFERAYHGETFGAMTVSDKMFYPYLGESFVDVLRLPLPLDGDEAKCIDMLHRYIESGDVAMFIFEPLVVGAGGMYIYDAGILDKLIKICNDNNIITIADEVMTGFYKLGRAFASNYLTNPPDVICLSKALTAGIMPMGITSFCYEIFDMLYFKNVSHNSIVNGHTYAANPLACTCAIASLDLFDKDKTKIDLLNIKSKNIDFRNAIINHPNVADIRLKGIILAIELKIDKKMTAQQVYTKIRNKLYNFFINKGVIIRPLGNIIYIMPSYCIGEDNLCKVYDVIKDSLDIDFNH